MLGMLAMAAAPTWLDGQQFGRARKFTMDLVCGTIGVRANLREAIRLAAAHGFESVAPDATQLARLEPSELDALLGDLKFHRLVWGASGLPVDFRRGEDEFLTGLRDLPRLAGALQRAGVARVGTWISPSHDDLTYLANFQQHVRRLRETAKLLNEYGLRFGLEYVGTKTLWTSRRHSFVHSMAECRELIDAINVPNMGLVLDSWHWYTAQESADDLLALKNHDVVACDLNDAPRNVPIESQIDSRRELPAATGVIDLRTFLRALVQIEYDGPVRAEPFNQELNELDDDVAVAATAAAIRRAFALVA
jgi:sugar phosphate isomerase/epimerase